MGKTMYPWDVAESAAGQLLGKLTGTIERAEIVGSIRRIRPHVHDIDLVVTPTDVNQFGMAIHKLADDRLVDFGAKIIRFRYESIPVDVYLADNRTWATLVLIRTGSRQHNIKLCHLARTLGMRLKADGSGLFSGLFGDGQWVAGKMEEEIFEALGLTWIPPCQRECNDPNGELFPDQKAG